MNAPSPLTLLGRRVERLLIAGIVLIGAAFGAFYLSFSALHYAEAGLAQGLGTLAELIEGDQAVLQRFYDLEHERSKLAKKKEPAPRESFYDKALQDKVARAAELSGAEAGALRRHIDAGRPPADLVAALRAEKNRLGARPAKVAGMMVPSASLEGALPAAFVANLLVIALAPLVIAWLGALYVTRRMELALAQEGGELHPHVLNGDFLPLAPLLERLHVTWNAQRIYEVRRTLTLFLRMAVLAMLFVPVIGAYVATIADLAAASEGSFLRYLYTAVVVVIMLVQAIVLLMGESGLLDRPEP
jgi:hypothetical protein